MSASRKYKLLGVNDDASFCSCCGRQGLKRVAWLVTLDPDGGIDSEAAPYGTSCAATLLGYSYPTSPAAKKRLETVAYEAMKAGVEAEINRIIETYTTLEGRYYILTDLLGDYLNGVISLKGAMDERKRRYPIMAVRDGLLTVQDAFNRHVLPMLQAKSDVHTPVAGTL